MTEAPLGEVAKFIRGVTFKPADLLELGSSGAVPCMRTKNVQETLETDDVWAVPESVIKRRDQYLRTGDTLISSANSWNLVGKCCLVPDLPGPTTFGGFVTVLRADESRVDPVYLYRWFSSSVIQQVVRSFGRRTTSISNLDLRRCESLPIALPSLMQQRRIARVLDAVDGLRAKRRQAVEVASALTESLFRERFGAVRENVRRLPVVRLSDLCCRITDGTHQSPDWAAFGHPFLFVKNITSGEIEFETEKLISDETQGELTRRCPIEVGDVLYSTVGSYGVPAIVRTQRKFAFQRHIAHLKPDPAIVHPEYLRAALASSDVRAQADRVARGVAQKTLNLGEIERFSVLAPSLQDQRAFAQEAEAAERVRATQAAHVGHVDALFASLQFRAFAGEL